MCRTLVSSALVAVVCCLPGSASAVVIQGLYNTGVDNAGVPLPNSASSIDTHYAIATNPDVGSDGFTHVEDETAFPVGSAWIANTPSSKWIAPRFDTAGSSGGLYAYELTFSLPANSVPSTATISGSWAFDDATTDAANVGIFLNGQKVVATTGGNYDHLEPFAIAAGSPFLTGTNTLSFRFINGGGYTGLMVNNLEGSVFTVAPEPASHLLLGCGLLAFARRWRFSRTKPAVA